MYTYIHIYVDKVKSFGSLLPDITKVLDCPPDNLPQANFKV